MSELILADSLFRHRAPQPPATPMTLHSESLPASAPADPLPAPTSRREPAYQLNARDSVQAGKLADALAELDYEYMDQPYEDLAGLRPDLSAWYRSVAAYALRFCRQAWRTYAYQRALDQACAVQQDCLTHCFLEPSPNNPRVWMPMKPEKVRALLGVLLSSALATHRAILNGDAPLNPGTTEGLHEAERRQR